MLINDQNQNLNSIDKKILDFYRKERFPLHYCIQNGKPEHFYHVFRGFIADCDGDKKYTINERDYNLNTQIHIAILSLDLVIVEHLLRHEANPNLKNAVNSTPLQRADHRYKDGSIVQCLLENRNKANPKLRNIIVSTALHVAVFVKILRQ